MIKAITSNLPNSKTALINYSETFSERKKRSLSNESNTLWLRRNIWRMHNQLPFRYTMFTNCCRSIPLEQKDLWSSCLAAIWWTQLTQRYGQTTRAESSENLPCTSPDKSENCHHVASRVSTLRPTRRDPNRKQLAKNPRNRRRRYSIKPKASPASRSRTQQGSKLKCH
jgi:hypothetical protein